MEESSAREGRRPSTVAALEAIVFDASDSFNRRKRRLTPPSHPTCIGDSGSPAVATAYEHYKFDGEESSIHLEWRAQRGQALILSPRTTSTSSHHLPFPRTTSPRFLAPPSPASHLSEPGADRDRGLRLLARARARAAGWYDDHRLPLHPQRRHARYGHRPASQRHPGWLHTVPSHSVCPRPAL